MNPKIIIIIVREKVTMENMESAKQMTNYELLEHLDDPYCKNEIIRRFVTMVGYSDKFGRATFDDLDKECAHRKKLAEETNLFRVK